MVKRFSTEFLFFKSILWYIENKKLKNLNKEFYRPDNCPNVAAFKVHGEI